MNAFENQAGWRLERAGQMTLSEYDRMARHVYKPVIECNGCGLLVDKREITESYWGVCAACDLDLTAGTPA